MANINHLEMAAAFKVLPQVEIKKCFFGLSTSMTYQKTNSKIHIIQNEYDASNGKLLEDTLLTSPEKLVEVGVPAKDIKKSSIGRHLSTLMSQASIPCHSTSPFRELQLRGDYRHEGLRRQGSRDHRRDHPRIIGCISRSVYILKKRAKTWPSLFFS